MIIDGLKLALVGMSVVFAFLVLLIIAIQLSAKLLQPYTKKEEQQAFAVPVKKISRPDNSRLVAVISAAISAHRARTQNL